MTVVWVCQQCSILQFRGEVACRRCGAAPPSGRAALVPRGAETEPILLDLPPIDFPYSRAARPRGRVRGWIAPVVMVLLAIGLAAGWDPLVRRYDAARAFGGESPRATQARAAELGDAAAELGALLAEGESALTGPVPALPGDWAARVRPLGRLHHLDGNAGSATLGEAEVAVRAVWLELVTLPPDAPPADTGARIQSLKEELSRVTSDLAHVR